MNGFTAHTPEEISYFRLASIKSQLKLEKVGLKSRGGALRPRICKEFGLPKTRPHDEFIAVIQKRMDDIIAAKQAQTVEVAK
jgi:hypothetical protein